MEEFKALGVGVVRKDRVISDGCTMRYYDTQGQQRTCTDSRASEEEPAIGESRLDPLVNEWIAVAGHR